MRTKELLEDNAEQVMQLMIQYAQSSRTYLMTMSHSLNKLGFITDYEQLPPQQTPVSSTALLRGYVKSPPPRSLSRP